MEMESAATSTPARSMPTTILMGMESVAMSIRVPSIRSMIPMAMEAVIQPILVRGEMIRSIQMETGLQTSVIFAR